MKGNKADLLDLAATRKGYKRALLAGSAGCCCCCCCSGGGSFRMK
jgi:hypothetical protein